MIGFIKRHIVVLIIIIGVSIYAYNNYLRPISVNEYIDKNSSFYINDLYLSDGLHYNSLRENEKLLYDKIVEFYKKFETDVELDLKDYGCDVYEGCDVDIVSVWNAVMMDHPELLQLSVMSYRYYNDSSIVKLYFNSGLHFNFQYTMGIMRIQRIIDEIKKATNGMSEKEKVKYVYEWIGSNNKYDKVFTYSSKNQSAYSAFINHRGVCAAYSKVSQIIFQNIGIESYMIHGESTGPHMWNIVKVDGKYYYYDSTVASAIKENTEMFYKGLLQSYVGGFTVYNKELFPETSTEEYLTE